MLYGVKFRTEKSRASATPAIFPAMATRPREDTREAIGRRLRMIREAYGRAQGLTKPMTQVEFAALIGTSKQSLNNYEGGRDRISIDTAIALSRRTGVPLNFIYMGQVDHLPHAIAIEIQKLERETSARRA